MNNQFKCVTPNNDVQENIKIKILRMIGTIISKLFDSFQLI